MSEKLKIKIRNQKQSFEILEEGVFISYQTAKHNLNYAIPFEEIQEQSYVMNNKNSPLLIGLCLSLLINFILILYIVFETTSISKNYIFTIVNAILISFAIVLSFISKGIKEKHIEASKLFYFFYTKKNEKEVDTFIDMIQQRKKLYYRNKHLKIDPVLPYHIQTERYLWLYDRKYINDTEYEIIKDDLDRYFNFNINNL